MSEPEEDVRVVDDVSSLTAAKCCPEPCVDTPGGILALLSLQSCEVHGICCNRVVLAILQDVRWTEIPVSAAAPDSLAP